MAIHVWGWLAASCLSAHTKRGAITGGLNEKYVRLSCRAVFRVPELVLRAPSIGLDVLPLPSGGTPERLTLHMDTFFVCSPNTW